MKDLDLKSKIETMSFNQGKIVSVSKSITLSDKLYIFGIVKGLIVTIKHFFKAITGKTYTLQYPEEKKEISKRWRGKLVLKRDEQGRERCVACMLCMLNCPSEAIYIEGEATKPEELTVKYPTMKHAKIWNYDMTRCIFCGICQEACPKGAVFLEKEYELADYNKSRLTYTKKELLEKTGGPIKFRD
jgi:NADH-quinone oxidoreductase subunit I